MIEAGVTASNAAVGPVHAMDALIVTGDGLVAFSAARGNVALQASPTTLRESLELREAFEGMMGRLCVGRATDEQVRDLQATALTSRSVAESRPEEFAACDAEFHRKLAVYSHNETLQCYAEALATLAGQLSDRFWDASKRDPVRAAHQHIDIADAVMRRDGDDAERRARDHVRAILMALPS